MVALRKAWSEAGIGADGVSGDLIKLQKALGGVNEEGLPTGAIFRQLGLNIEQLKGQSAIDEILAVGGAINNLGDDASRTAAITQIFGREGASLKAVFADLGSINEARESTRGLGEIMQRDAGLFKAIANDLEALKNKVRGFFTGFADTISPVLLPLLDKLKNAINLTGLGQQAGAEIATVAKTLYGLFESGHLSETAGLALRVGFANATDWLSAKFTEIMSSFSGAGSGWAKGLKDAFTNVKDIFSGLADVMAGAITKGILTGLENISIKGIKIFDTGALGAGEVVADFQQKLGMDKVKGGLEGLGKTDIGGAVGDLLKGLGHNAEDAAWALKENITAARFAAAGLTKVGEATKPIAGTGKLEALKPINTMKPLTDNLAKIGLFVGGNGGQLGQRAAQDTARNTGILVSSFATLNRNIEELHRDLKPTGARF